MGQDARRLTLAAYGFESTAPNPASEPRIFKAPSREGGLAPSNPLHCPILGMGSQLRHGGEIATPAAPFLHLKLPNFDGCDGRMVRTQFAASLEMSMRARSRMNSS